MPHSLPYRSQTITSSAFYTEGTSPYYDFFHELFLSFCHDFPDVQMSFPADIYAIRDNVQSRMFAFEDSASPRVLISPNWKDGHATTFITLLDPLTRFPLAILFMNSEQNEAYFQQAKWQFSQINQQSISALFSGFIRHYGSIEGVRDVFLKQSNEKSADLCSMTGLNEMFEAQVKSYLTKTFSIDMDNEAWRAHPATLLINKSARTALAINYSAEDYDKDEYKEIEASPLIDFIYYFNPKEDYLPLLRLTVPKTPFIDVSHHLQLNSDDENCVLYVVNFIQGMVEMLKQPGMLDKVTSFAAAAQENVSAKEDLVRIFQDELRVYLPCYYDEATGIAKSQEALEAFHLKQRWEMGSKAISMRYPIRSMGSRARFFAEKEVAPEVSEKKSICSLL